MMYSAVLLLYAILKQRGGVPKTGKGAEGHGAREWLLIIHLMASVVTASVSSGARERLLIIHLMEVLRKDGKYATKLGLEPSIKMRVLAGKKYSGGAHGAERESQ